VNTKQKIVLSAVIIIVLMGLFPPWRAYTPPGLSNVPSMSLFAGYSLLVWPPGKDHPGLFGQHSKYEHTAYAFGSVRIDGMTLLVQWAIVAIAAWGLAYAFGGKGKDKSGT